MLSLVNLIGIGVANFNWPGPEKGYFSSEINLEVIQKWPSPLNYIAESQTTNAQLWYRPSNCCFNFSLKS